MLTSPKTPLVAKFQAEVIDTYKPGIKIVWKDESLLMKFVYYISFMFLWNKTFLSHYATVGGGYIWVPKETWSQKTEEERLRAIVHEGAHLYDSRNNPFWSLLYVSPAIFFVPLSVGLAFVSPWFLLLLLLALVPWPSPWRYWGEIRAYRLDLLFCEYVWGWPKGEGLHKHMQKVTVEQLSGSYYYFAWPFPNQIIKDREKDDSKDPYVKMVFEWLKKEGLLKKPFPS